MSREYFVISAAVGALAASCSPAPPPAATGPAPAASSAAARPSATPTAAAASAPAPSAEAPSAPGAPTAAPAPTAAGRIVTGGPLALPAAWGRCEKDADCTFASLGCCSVTPVARARAADAKQKLEASGRPYCAPKAACGPGPDGTFAGAPGKCTKGACGCDPAAPLYKNCLGE